MLLDELISEARVWCKGKSWKWRLPILLFVAYISIRHFFDPDYSSILAPIDLGIHELGHLLFAFLGQGISVAGGTLLQLGIPVFGIFNFYRQRDFFAISLCFGWIAVNLFEVARYCGDARALQLPLVSVFGQETVVHDWEFMLSSMGILRWDTAIAGAIQALGAVMTVLCITAGGWLLTEMAYYKSGKTGTSL